MVDNDPTGGDASRIIRAIQEISLARDLDSITHVVKHAARSLTGADGVTFVLREEGHCFYVDEDAISPLWKGKRFPLDVCISGWSMLHRDTVVIEDIYADPRIPHEAYRPTFVKSLAMVPVRARDPVAAIGAYWATHHRATEHETSLLRSLAEATAVAIENVQLIQALQEKAEESSRLLEQFKAEVSRREDVEAELRQAQKMEAVGRLAGGVAHDFNNLLTVIMTYSEFALQGLPGDDPAFSDVQEIQRAAERAESLTRQLLAFGRKQVLQPRILHLNELVVSMDHLLRRVIGENVDVATFLAEDLAPVFADPGQIDQIIMNLAINARDAMPGSGKLTIETANVALDEEYARNHRGAEAGPHVMLAVSDNGVGMDAETRRRIFEPFFTTKEKGKGTGLGLSTVYGIVKQSGGSVWVYSELTRGTTFKVYLPEAPRDAAPMAEPREAPAATHGTETILVVEDEPMVRRLVRRILERAGHTVLSASSAEQAEELCREHEGTIDLLVTDIVLTSADGRELAERLTEMRPGLKVLYMSGYTDDAVIRHGVLEPGMAFVQKPLTPDSLLKKLREAIGSG